MRAGCFWVFATVLALGLSACGSDRCACRENAQAGPGPLRVEPVMIADAQRIIVAGGDAWTPPSEVLEELDMRLTHELFVMAAQERLERGVDGWSRRYWGHHDPGEAPRIEVQILCDRIARSDGNGLRLVLDSQDCVVHATYFPETKKLDM